MRRCSRCRVLWINWNTWVVCCDDILSPYECPLRPVQRLLYPWVKLDLPVNPPTPQCFSFTYSGRETLEQTCSAQVQSGVFFAVVGLAYQGPGFGEPTIKSLFQSAYSCNAVAALHTSRTYIYILVEIRQLKTLSSGVHERQARMTRVILSGQTWTRFGWTA